MPWLRLILLLLSSSLCVALMFWDSWRRRGGRITLLFFSTCTLYAIVRGHIVRYITVEQWQGAAPYAFSHETVQILGEPIPAIVGWIFTIYLSWCLAERIVDRLGISRSNLFAQACFAFLSTASISYLVETSADAAHWWGWALSRKNALFVAVPTIGIVDWAAIISDYLIPFWLFFLSPLRKKAWRWLLFLPFALHMLAHSPYQFYLPYLGYFFTVAHVAIFLLSFLLALWHPKWAQMEVTGPGIRNDSLRSNGIPLLTYTVLLLVALAMQVSSGSAAESFISFGPFILIGCLAFVGLPASAVALMVVVLLSILWDTRWLAAGVIPVFAGLLAVATGDRPRLLAERLQGTQPGSGETGGFSEKAPGRVKIIRWGSALLAVTLSGWITVSDYRFEERCRHYEKEVLRKLVREPQGRSPQAFWKRSREAVQEAPADADYLLALGKTLEERRAPLPIVAVHYEKAIEVDPEFSVPYSKLASVLSRLDDNTGAVQVLQEGHQRIPADTTILNNLGYYSRLRGEVPTAVEYLQKACKISADNHLIWLNLAQAYLVLDDLDSARDCLAEARRLEADNPDVRTVEVLLDLATGQRAGAEDALRDILREHPKALLARLQLARLLEEAEDWQGALGEYLTLCQEQPLSERQWLEVIRLAEKAEDADSRLRALDEALKSHPASYALRGHFAEALAEAGRFSEAAQRYAELAGMRPGSFGVRLNLGAMLFEAGDLEAALAETSRARLLDPSSPVANYNLGLIRLCLEDRQGALEAYGEALAQDQGGRLVAEARGELRKAQSRVPNASDFLRVERLLTKAMPPPPPSAPASDR